MKFSVIVPVYNVEKFLAKCLDSILYQDFDDYEIIAVNDGSTDSSPEILDEYSKKTDKLKVINQKNKGLGGARNTAIENACGDYLVFVDSDDFIPTDMLSTLTVYFDKYNLDIISFDLTAVYNYESVDTEVADSEDEFVFLGSKEFLISEPTACAKAYRRSLYTDNNIRFPERLWYEDLATVYRLVPFANKIGYLNKPLYYYVQQPGSITHSANTTRMMEIITAFDTLESYFKEIGCFEEYYAELEWLCVKHVLYYSAHRFLTKGYYYKQMNALYNYVCLHYPKFKINKYVKEYMPSIYCMNLIVNKHFFRFYVKECLRVKSAKVFRKVFPKK